MTAPSFTRLYDRTEIAVDAAVHGLGLLAALVGVALLIPFAADAHGPGGILAASVYGAGLIFALAASTAYNMWPPSPTKWLLRRVDHSAIFVLIAATYTPFLAQMPADLFTAGTFLYIWGIAAVGVLLKCAFPGRWDRLTVLLYLGLGWSGVVLWPTLEAVLGSTTLWLILAGGIAYSAGVVFHLWERLRFQNAIWHVFVVAGAAVHYGAVYHCLVVRA